MFCKTVCFGYYCSDDVVCEIEVRYKYLSMLHSRIDLCTRGQLILFSRHEGHIVFIYPHSSEILDELLLSLDLSRLGVSVIRFIDMKG